MSLSTAMQKLETALSNKPEGSPALAEREVVKLLGRMPWMISQQRDGTRVLIWMEGGYWGYGHGVFRQVSILFGADSRMVEIRRRTNC